MGDDNPEHITAREFDRFQEAITNTILEGFGGINSRLDKLNSKVERHELAIGHLNSKAAVNDVRVEGHSRKLDKIDTGFRHARKDDPPPSAESITVKITPKIWAALAAFGGAVLVMLLEWAKKQAAQP